MNGPREGYWPIHYHHSDRSSSDKIPPISLAGMAGLLIGEPVGTASWSVAEPAELKRHPKDRVVTCPLNSYQRIEADKCSVTDKGFSRLASGSAFVQAMLKLESRDLVHSALRPRHRSRAQIRG